MPLKYWGLSLFMVFGVARAANPDLQTLFFAACTSATGALAERCQDTPNGEGNLSGDSESSLNPSQILSGGRVALSEAALLSRTNQEDDERLDARFEHGRWGVFVNATGLWEDYDRSPDVDRERAYEQRKYLLDFGVDYRVSEHLVAGLLVNYGKTTLDYDKENPGVNFNPRGRAGYIDSTGLGIGVFFSWQLNEQSYLELGMGANWRDLELERRAIFQESTRTLPQIDTINRGRTDGQDTWLSLNVGWDGNAGSWAYGAYGMLVYLNTQIDAFSEKDITQTGLAMRYSASQQTALTGMLGGRLQKAVSFSRGVWLPYGRIEFVHEFRNDPLTTTASYLEDAGGHVLYLSSDAMERNYFNVTLGSTWVLPEGWMPFIDLTYTLDYTDLNRFQAVLGIRKEL